MKCLKDMTRDNDFEFFSVCPASRGISNARETGNVKKEYYYKRKNRICVAIFIAAAVLLRFIIIPRPKCRLPKPNPNNFWSWLTERTQKLYQSIVVCLLRYTNSSKIQKSKRTKRYLKMNEFNEYEDIKLLKTNLEIVPENRRTGSGSNHGHVKKELGYNGHNTTHKSNIRKAFRLAREPKTHKNRNDIQNVGKRGKLIRESKSSMRLKGIYVQSKRKEGGETGNQLNEKQFYSKEINNLMQNDSVGEEKKRKWPAKKTYRSNGSPFQLPTKGRESLKKQNDGQDSFRLNQISRKHPITVYLDFYPVSSFENFTKKSKSDSSLANRFRNMASSQSVKFEKILLPRGKRNRMIMKLNLYPKEYMPSEQDAKSFPTKYSERAERRWFLEHKKKKNHSKGCSITVLHPNGKCTMGKSKNEDGEWIHA